MTRVAPPEEPALSPTRPIRERGRSSGGRQNRVLILAIRLLFMVLLMAVTLLTLASQATPGDFGSSTFVGLLVAAAALGLVVVLADAVTPNKRLTSVVAVYLGICFGLIGASRSARSSIRSRGHGNSSKARRRSTCSSPRP